jgi:hypothetical protein
MKVVDIVHLVQLPVQKYVMKCAMQPGVVKVRGYTLKDIKGIHIIYFINPL